LDLDQGLVELIRYGLGRTDGPLAPRHVLQEDVEAVREDQVRDLFAMLEQGIEGVHPAAEEAADAGSRRPGLRFSHLGLHGDALEPVLIPGGRYRLRKVQGAARPDRWQQGKRRQGVRRRTYALLAREPDAVLVAIQREAYDKLSCG